MLEFIVIVESRADAETATCLAERLFIEKIDWLEREQLPYFYRWSGLEENTNYSCWKDVPQILEQAKSQGLKIPKFIGNRKAGVIKADGAASRKILNFIRILQKERSIRAVVLMRDLDNQPERREGIDQARSEQISRSPQLEIIIGTADRMREAWVLNGFVPLNNGEERILQSLKSELMFDPCEESQKLRSNSWQEPERNRNPKVVLARLTCENREREQQCWEETSLELLIKRGKNTGLTAYLEEIEQRLIPLIH